MATNPKYPLESGPGPQVVSAPASQPPRSFKLIVAGVVVLVAAVVILLAIWLLKFGGGSPQEQPKPHQAGNGTPSGMFVPVLPRI